MRRPAPRQWLSGFYDRIYLEAPASGRPGTLPQQRGRLPVHPHCAGRSGNHDVGTQCHACSGRGPAASIRTRSTPRDAICSMDCPHLTRGFRHCLRDFTACGGTYSAAHPGHVPPRCCHDDRDGRCGGTARGFHRLEAISSFDPAHCDHERAGTCDPHLLVGDIANSRICSFPPVAAGVGVRQHRGESRAGHPFIDPSIPYPWPLGSSDSHPFPEGIDL